MSPVPTATKSTASNDTDTPLAQGRFLVGSLLLLAAIAASGVLTYQQIAGANIPGCGPGSACGELARSAWGRVPVVDWPVSFLGLAYFVSLFVAWIALRGALSGAGAVRWLVRLGALASIVFIGVMVSKGLICPYCLVAHLANLAFVALVEVTGRTRGAGSGARETTSAGAAGVGGASLLRWQGASALTIAFLSGTLVIAVANQQAAKTAGKQDAADFDASMQEMLRAAGGQTQPASTTPATHTTPTTATPSQPQTLTQQPSEVPPSEPAPAIPPVARQDDSTATSTTPATPPSTTVQTPATPTTTSSTPSATPPATPPAAPVLRSTTLVQPAGFTGRHRWGPEKAGIRIVMYTGYQCPDCRTMDTQVKQVLAQWPDLVNFSIKHFPMSNVCNTHMGQSNMHPNACWAARAAEAAAIVGGFDGFERMHNWLYSRGGAFTEPELRQGLAQLGFEPNYFISLLNSPQTLAPIQAEIEEAMRYGLSHTPMIFINGVELKGWRTPNALVRAVDVLAATNPEKRGPENDRPPNAADKAIADWREAPQQSWPSRQKPWALGPETAQVKIQVFGDLQEPNTAEVDQIIRNAMAGRDDIRYEYRYFPADQSCNPHVQRSPYPLGCRAARVAETAGQLGGDQAYWRMHEWLMANQRNFSDASVRAFVSSLRLDPATFMAALEGDGAPEVAKAISDDISIGQRLHMTSLPRIYINGKVVARWNLPGEFILERIIEEAAIAR